MRTLTIMLCLMLVTMTLGLTACTSKSMTSAGISVYQAADKGNSGAIEEAIHRGFKINTPDANGDTVLHHAAAHNQADLCELLTQNYRANPNLKDKQGLTPIQLAQKKGAMRAVQILREN